MTVSSADSCQKEVSCCNARLAKEKSLFAAQSITDCTKRSERRIKGQAVEAKAKAC